jgi:hypothetical protein
MTVIRLQSNAGAGNAVAVGNLAMLFAEEGLPEFQTLGLAR